MTRRWAFSSLDLVLASATAIPISGSSSASPILSARTIIDSARRNWSSPCSSDEPLQTATSWAFPPRKRISGPAALGDWPSGTAAATSSIATRSSSKIAGSGRLDGLGTLRHAESLLRLLQERSCARHAGSVPTVLRRFVQVAEQLSYRRRLGGRQRVLLHDDAGAAEVLGAGPCLGGSSGLSCRLPLLSTRATRPSTNSAAATYRGRCTGQPKVRRPEVRLSSGAGVLELRRCRW